MKRTLTILGLTALLLAGCATPEPEIVDHDVAVTDATARRFYLCMTAMRQQNLKDPDVAVENCNWALERTAESIPGYRSPWYKSDVLEAVRLKGLSLFVHGGNA
jgi:hypothetical protein